MKSGAGMVSTLALVLGPPVGEGKGGSVAKLIQNKCSIPPVAFGGRQVELDDLAFEVLDAIAAGDGGRVTHQAQWIAAFETIGWIVRDAGRLSLTREGRAAHRDLARPLSRRRAKRQASMIGAEPRSEPDAQAEGGARRARATASFSAAKRTRSTPVR
ncbi:MAG TPA: hypothetical protein VFE13_20770 [Caulobacteraceae bacterium]|jgi:hypothetical protein|nr:hypothetical protein [Caulobacteraceae bacterium]